MTWPTQVLQVKSRTSRRGGIFKDYATFHKNGGVVHGARPNREMPLCDEHMSFVLDRGATRATRHVVTFRVY
jgi:hypothetical protein